MRKAIVVLVVAGMAALLLSIGCDQGQKKVQIRFKFKQGMKMTYTQVARGTLEQYSNDVLRSNRSNEYTATLDWYIPRVFDDGTAEIVETKSINMTTSDKDTPRDVDTMTEKRELTMYVKPNGHVEDIDVDDDKSPSSLNYLKNYLEQGQPVFPEGEVSEGHSWTQTTKVILPDGPMDASTTYEIKSFARERGYDCVIIAYDGDLILPLEIMNEESFKLVDGVDNIHAGGHIYFAYEEGMIVRQTEKWVLDGLRTWVVTKEDTTMRSWGELKPGDTLHNHLMLEYDVNHELTDLKREM